MDITIAERLRPFTTVPGTPMLLPRTDLICRIYPTRIEIGTLAPLSLKLTGPFKNFTVQQDLEKGALNVWGEAQEGYFRYTLAAPLTLTIERAPKEGLPIESDLYLRPKPQVKGVAYTIESEGKWKTLENMVHPERLSLGCHKSQDWQMVQRRCALDEILPFWYRLSQSIPEQEPIQDHGADTLFSNTIEAIQTQSGISSAFQNLYRATFHGLLTPIAEDTHHQGLPSISSSKNPLALLQASKELIRSLFIQKKEKGYVILPSPFHCGRLLHIRCGELGSMDIEWSKKQIRRITFYAQSDGELPLYFHRDIKTFRLRSSEKITTLNVGTAISLKKNQTYHLDHFTK